MTAPAALSGAAAPAALIAGFSGAHLLTMASFSAVPALGPAFAEAWTLSPSALGWLNGVMFLGYFVATPVLATASDRVDPRSVYIGAAILGAVAQIWFALGADGLASALAPRCLAGAALAGSYMPGLKALTDRLPSANAPRATAIYTAGFALGASLSFLLAGLLTPWIGWRGLFWLGGGASALAGLLVAWVAKPQKPAPAVGGVAQGLAAAARDRRFRGWAICYACHCAEQFAWRGWAVAYLGFAAARTGVSIPLDPPVAVAAAVALAAPASVLGGEAAQRWGRRRYLLATMGASAVVGAVSGWASGWPVWGLLAIMLTHAVLLNADSAAMTAGVVAETPAERRGAALALYSMAGFFGAFVGPAAFGWALEVGGADRPGAWAGAFALLAIGVALGGVAAWRADRRRPQDENRDQGRDENVDPPRA